MTSSYADYLANSGFIPKHLLPKQPKPSEDDMGGTCEVQQAYEIMVWSKPKKVEEKAEVLVDRKTVMAPTLQVAERIAARLVPDAWGSRLDEVEIRVKLF